MKATPKHLLLVEIVVLTGILSSFICMKDDWLEKGTPIQLAQASVAYGKFATLGAGSR